MITLGLWCLYVEILGVGAAKSVSQSSTVSTSVPWPRATPGEAAPLKSLRMVSSEEWMKR